MAVKDVEKAIRDVRRTIRDHWYPHHGEASTRWALIDPIIRALGWETHDPKQCEVEYPIIEDGKVDYALFDRCKYIEYEEVEDDVEFEDYDEEEEEFDIGLTFHFPVILIEAKSLGADLTNPEYVRQLSRYCDEIGHAFAVLTDGRYWHLYDLESDKRRFSQKRFKIIDVYEGSIKQSARELNDELSKREWW